MSRILNRQRQLAEQGRLRLGYTAPTSSGKTRPKASTTWVVTSHSREHVETAAQLWGGQVEEWQPQGNGAKQWRVITEATTIDAILPPGDPLSQAYEMWNRGGCVRRCDGITEQLSGSPCPCYAQYGEDWYEQGVDKVCQSKSRLKVLLPEMPGLGSWRVETGSYYATDEIAGMVDVIRGAVGDQVMVPVRLRIEPRQRVAGGQTKRFVVPVLELRGVTSGAILGGQYVGLAQIETRQQAAIEAASHVPSDLEDEFTDRIADAGSLDELRQVWKQMKAARADTPHVIALFKAAVAEFRPDEDKPAEPVEDAEPEPNPDEQWQAILKAHGERGDDMDVVRAAFASWSGGVAVEDANGFQMADYLRELQAVAS